jgi:hypothetical protein
MSRTLLYGFTALALTALAWPADQAIAITHGCTDPPDIKNLVINVDLDGKQSQVSGKYCQTIQQAVALVNRSTMSQRGKDGALRALAAVEDRGRTAAAGGSAQVNVKCDTDGNCTVGGSLTIVF